MIRAEVLTSWIVENAGTPLEGNVPQVFSDYPLQRCKDVTEQPTENIPPATNQCTVYIECDDAVMAQIEADANYYVLWSETV